MPHCAILGTGLIGSSIGLGLRHAGWTVTGWDPDGEAMRTALEVGAVDQSARRWQDAMEGVELVVLAGPPAAVVETLGALPVEGLNDAALITDVAGVKEPVVDAARHLQHFVGGHPMAGREQAGPTAASAALFRGAAWIIVTDHADPTDVDRLTAVVETLGAEPIRMTAVDHDDAVAAISHVPQVLAAALLEGAAAEGDALLLAAGSFRDLTRVASSEPAWWSELLVANGRHVGRALARLRADLETWETDLAEGRVEQVTRALQAARRTRASLSPPVVSIGVVLEDRPGELAAVGAALATSGVDVRDLQLRHGLHGGGGILTLSVRPGEAGALRQALTAHGFVLTE